MAEQERKYDPRDVIYALLHVNKIRGNPTEYLALQARAGARFDDAWTDVIQIAHERYLERHNPKPTTITEDPAWNGDQPGIPPRTIKTQSISLWNFFREAISGTDAGSRRLKLK